MRSVRIIGGQWRGQHLRFRPHPSIRPTPNRARETLFNWLEPYVRGADCLDLFAGSGALSFEALSRGAASCTLIDNNSATCGQIRDEAARFAIRNIEVRAMDARSFVRAPMRPYDIIFLDPPFFHGLLDKALAPLDQAMRGNKTLVYIEMGRHESCIPPKSWRCLHSKKTREIRYSLLCNKA